MQKKLSIIKKGVTMLNDKTIAYEFIMCLKAKRYCEIVK
jgi:hypothetical protein